jgi:D-apiose dehydrogenase
VITHPNGHAALVHLAIRHRIPVVCQKPIAPTLDEAGVFFAIHENWQWQTPIGSSRPRSTPERSAGRSGLERGQYSNSFPYWVTEPALLEEERFIVVTLGVHILDVTRYLFGEPDSVYYRTRQVKPDIRGEDVATLVIAFCDLTCTVELSYASRLERERFPETYVLVEAERSSVELGPDYWVRGATEEGTHSRRHPPTRYPWANPAYELVHASIVPCHADILRALREGAAPRRTPATTLRPHA